MQATWTKIPKKRCLPKLLHWSHALRLDQCLSHRWGSSLPGLCRLDPLLSPTLTSKKNFGTHFCKVTFNHFPQLKLVRLWSCRLMVFMILCWCWFWIENWCNTHFDGPPFVPPVGLFFLSGACLVDNIVPLLPLVPKGVCRRKKCINFPLTCCHSPTTTST